MIKKILLLLIISFSIISISNITFGACSYNGGNISSSINTCLLGSQLVDASGDMAIENEFKTKINDWVYKLGGFLGLIAIGAIVWGSFMMVISTGEEEKTKKAKDMIKWAILGFLGVVLASSLIMLIVNFMYELG